MFDVRWTRQALRNLETITAYIARDNPLAAKQFSDAVFDRVEHLTQFPALGRPGRVSRTRELVVHENYVVPYRVKGNCVDILRVQHGNVGRSNAGRTLKD